MGISAHFSVVYVLHFRNLYPDLHSECNGSDVRLIAALEKMPKQKAFLTIFREDCL